MAQTHASQSLKDRLADVLPPDVPFKIYHLSTPPTLCAPIYSAPPGTKPQKTYCESNFLAVAIESDDQELFILGLEVLIYTTAHLTTLFVSKADSTGYIHLTTNTRSDASPIRTITSTFISWLVQYRQRAGIRLVVSLFARAQDQYLFPGSVENAGKHVLDDRGLVKWWCKVLDPVLRKYPVENEDANPFLEFENQLGTTAKGYLIVPGFDRHETTYFLPQSARTDPPSGRRWVHGHPLRTISASPSASPRCLIPRFPDDPKARFLDELDEEIPDAASGQVNESPSKRTGHWRSVKSLEQFWELMAFRQECSSGRLVGFIWVVFSPPDFRNCDIDTGDGQTSLTPGSLTVGNSPPGESHSQEQETATGAQKDCTPSPMKCSIPLSPLPSSQLEHEENLPTRASLGASRRCVRRKRKQLSGLIVPRAPRTKSASSSLPSTASPSETSRYYYWPPSGRGEILFDEKQYRRLTELLLRLDFGTQPIAAASTKKWIDEIGAVLGQENGWGETVQGRRVASAMPSGRGESQSLNSVSVRKKRKPETTQDAVPASSVVAHELTGDLLGKNPKLDSGEALEAQAAARTVASEPNLLDSGLVRKKPKLAAHTTSGSQG